MSSVKIMPWPRWQRTLAIGLAYLGSILLSRLLSHQSPTTTYISFWLPAGIYVAGLLRAEVRDWLALVLTVAAVNVGLDLQTGTPLSLTLMLVAANTAEAMAGAFLFRRFVSRNPRLTTLREFFGLVTYAVVLGAALGATIGASALVVTGYSNSFWDSWTTWWIGNAMAILLVTPFVLVWASPREEEFRWRNESRRLAEIAGLVAGVTVSAWQMLVLGGGIVAPYKSALALFILWAAIRFGIRGASAINLLFGLLITFLTSHYLKGLSAEQVSSGSYLQTVQLFLAINALIGLIPAIAIEERNLLVRRLGHSEERFRNLSAATYEGVILTEGGRVLDANDQALKLLGYERAELLDREVVTLIDPGSRALVDASIRTDREASYEHRLLRKDGTVLDAEARAKVMHFGGRKIRMTAIRDVTERKRTDETLRASLREVTELRTALDEHAIVAITDPEGMITFANDKFCATSKYARQELLGQDHRIVNSGYHPKEFFANLWTTIKEGRVWHGEIKNRAKDGSFYWSATTIVPFFNKDGKPRQYVAIRADISEQKRNEEAFKQAREVDFQFLADALPQMIWTAKPDGRLDYCNQRWLGYTGLTLEQTKDWGWQSVLHPGDLAIYGERWTRAFATGSGYEVEYRFKRASDGTYRWHLGRAFPQRDTAGQIIKWIGACTDIHDQKQVSALLEQRVQERTLALHTSEEQFRMAFEFAGTGMALVGLDGRWLRVNRALCDLVGYTEQDLLGRTFQDITHPDDLETDLHHMRELIAGTANHYQMEKRYIHRDGSIVWIRLTASIVRDALGNFTHLVSQIEDITDRRKVEAALRESEERYRAMVETVQDYAIFLLDADGRVASWNAGAARTQGYLAEEIIGRYYSVFFPPELSNSAAGMLAAASERGQIETEGWRVRKDGSRFWANVLLTALRNEQGALVGFSKVTRDVTTRKGLQDQLVERNAALEIEAQRAQEANRLKSEFLANMSHELRTPLNGIIGFSSFLAGEKPGPLNARQKEFLGDVLASSQHLLRLINDLLDLAKIEAGKVELATELFSLRTVMAEVVGVVSPLLHDKQLDFEALVQLEDDGVNLDPQRIKQVLYNLLSNAIKFTRAGGRIRLLARPRGDREIELVVIDSGIGIKPADFARLFTEFQQLDSGSSRLYQGTGLGLALTKKIVSLHGGTIEVESVVGHGTTFTVVLPRAIVSPVA